jgi:Tfp pilus assembly protein PilF
VTLLVLVFSAVALYLVTSFLFRSFSARRAELGREFAQRGQQDVREGNAKQAIQDLRISLEYAPDQMYNRLLLAEALAAAHHPDQARSYFLTLLDQQPADGFINLQLARLERQRGDAQRAIDYYRASAVGNWSTGSADERFRVQTELADYLIQRGDLPSARAELLIAAADAPDEPNSQETLGDRFVQANDLPDALNLYRKAIKLSPENTELLYKAGRVAYSMNEFDEAAKLLSVARRESAAAKLDPKDAVELETLLASSRRIQELTLSQDVVPQDRVEHILRALPIAKARFDGCEAHFNNGQVPAGLQALENRWTDAEHNTERRSLLEDQGQQDALVKLIFDTEQQTQQVCGAPQGDDALLLELSNASRTGR